MKCVLVIYVVCNYNIILKLIFIEYIYFLFNVLVLPIKYSLLIDCYQDEMNCWYTLSHKFFTP